jgi:ABC-type Fe2+-enterobactin transport system substrate-binding protein
MNHENEVEFHYAQFIVRFDAATKLFRELTLLPNCLASINGYSVVWSGSLLRWLGSQDAKLVEGLGVVLSIKLGIALTGFHDGDEPEMAIHVFRRGDWDALERRMKPFTSND